MTTAEDETTVSAKKKLLRESTAIIILNIDIIVMIIRVGINLIILNETVHQSCHCFIIRNRRTRFGLSSSSKPTSEALLK